MPEIRTTECNEAGQRELVLRFDDPNDAPFVAKWGEELTLRAFDGERFTSGDRVRLHRTRFQLEDEGDLLALHEDDLTSPDDDVRYLPGVGRAASSIRAGIELAESFGAAWQAVDPRYGTLAVCPEVHAKSGFGLISNMARTHPLDHVDWPLTWLEQRHGVAPKPFPSGWYLGCSNYETCRGRGPRGRWISVRFAELVAARPELVRFLWLDVGTIVEDPLGKFETVRRLRTEVSRDDPWNFLRVSADTAIKIAVETDRLPLLPDSPEAKWRARLINLDPSRHASILDCYSRSSASDAVTKRYGLSEQAALHAITEALRDERLADWLAVDPAVTVAREHIAPLVRELLAAPDGPRWSLQNEVARGFHKATNVPFVEAKAHIVSLDNRLSALLRLRG